MKQATIALTTLGCKVNQYDSAVIAESLRARGHEITDFQSPADIYIINTCTVTHRTDYQSRQLIRRAFRNNPRARIIVTGCYAQVAPETLAQIPGVSLVLGNAEKYAIADFIAQGTGSSSARVDVSDLSREARFIDPPLRTFPSHTRAFLKIQDGCESFCSFCIVPYARGKCRSLPPQEVLDRLFNLSAAGYKEVVLSGIHLGAYGSDLTPVSNLLALLLLIETARPLQRIRLSSLEPMDITRELIAFLATSRTVCPHLHIPLQSGNDSILKRMNRPYGVAYAREMMETLHTSIPGLCLGIDLIAGFPGETDEQFRSTYAMLEILPVSYAHIFPYSRRGKTPAASFPGQIAPQTITSRSALLRNLGNRKRSEFHAAFLGKQLRVLVEGGEDGRCGPLRGRSTNYIPVTFEGPARLHNQEVTVVAERLEKERVWATWQDPS